MAESNKGKTIAIVGGTGKEGRGMAMRWARAGYKVLIGSRDATRAAEKATALTARGHGTIGGSDNASVVAKADVVVLSVPYSAHGATLEGLKEALQGRIVIDITVPLKPPAVRTVHLPQGQAAALEAQAILGPDAKVVAAMHHVSSAHLADMEHTIDCDVLACSDDDAALSTALEVISDLGVTAYHAGPLANAVALESLTPVLLHLNKHYKRPGAGLKLTNMA